MSFADCLARAVEAGEADKGRAEAVTDAWKAKAAEYERFGYTRHEAEGLAADHLKKALADGVKQKRHKLAHELAMQARNARMIDSVSLRDAREAPIRVLQANIASGIQAENVVGQMDAMRSSFFGMIGDFLGHHHPDILNRVRDNAGLKDVVREIVGEKTGNAAAKAYGEAISATFERARVLFNSYGGDIGKIDGWFPHQHDRDRIISAGRDGWTARMMEGGVLDWTKIIDKETGKAFSSDGLPPPKLVQENFLHRIYDGIASDGWIDRQPTWGAPFGVALHNRYADARVLHFQSADAWMKYNDDFGLGDTFTQITGHISRMARDIAMMKVLGPNPKAGIDNVFQHAMKKLAGTAEEEKLKANYEIAKAMLSELSGDANTPFASGTARMMAAFRQTLSAAHLGSAALVSGSDSVAMAGAAKTMGMNPTAPLAKHVSLMASGMSRDEAKRLGYIADTMWNSGATMERFLGEAPIARWAETLNGFVMRAQGLSFWTDHAKMAVSMSFEAEITGKAFSELADRQKRILTSRGITEADWAVLQDPSRHMEMANGQTILNLKHWRERALSDGIDALEVERIVGTLGGLQQEIVHRSIPSVDHEMRARVAAIGGNARPGSVPGELQKSFLSYKSYALAFTGIQMQQIMAQPTAMSVAQYVALMLAGFTMAGALGVQLKEVAKGNDPRPMDHSGFWAAAAMQGGGLGIVGDLANASTTRLGGGLMGYFAGPTVGFANDLGSLTIGNAMQAVNGEDMKLGREVVKFGERYTPGMTLWPVRAALDRGVADALHMLLDPEAEARMRQEAKRQMSEYGNGRFWPAGSFTPERAPQMP